MMLLHVSHAFECSEIGDLMVALLVSELFSTQYLVEIYRITKYKYALKIFKKLCLVFG